MSEKFKKTVVTAIVVGCCILTGIMSGVNLYHTVKDAKEEKNTDTTTTNDSTSAAVLVIDYEA